MFEFHSEEERVEKAFDMLADFDTQTTFVRDKSEVLTEGEKKKRTFVIPFSNVRYFLLDKDENTAARVGDKSDFSLDMNDDMVDPYEGLVDGAPGTPLIGKKMVKKT